MGIRVDNRVTRFRTGTYTGNSLGAYDGSRTQIISVGFPVKYLRIYAHSDLNWLETSDVDGNNATFVNLDVSLWGYSTGFVSLSGNNFTVTDQSEDIAGDPPSFNTTAEEYTWVAWG